MNVINKIVIPKTNVTVTYIVSELEELAREEFSRLKKVKAKKKRDSMKKHDHVEGHICPICDKRLDEKAKVVMEDETQYILEAKQVESQKEELKPIILGPPVTISDRIVSPLIPQSSAGSNITSKLEYLKVRLNKIITISKEFIETGIDRFDMNEFLKICETAKVQIETIFNTEQNSDQIDDTVKDQMTQLKLNLQEVVDSTKEFSKEGISTPTQSKDCQEKQIDDFKSHIDDVMKMTQSYTAEGLLSTGADEFLRSCSVIKARIEGKPIKPQYQSVDEEKLDHLKIHVSELEQLTEYMEQKGISSESVDRFKFSCEEFKRKIDEDKEKLEAKRIMNEIAGHIDGTLSCCKIAQKEGLLSESVEDFMKSIGDVKKQINKQEQTQTVEAQEPNVLNTLKSHIDNIIKSVTKLKSGDILSVGVDDFLHSCETAKAKIDIYQKYYPIDLEKRMIYPTCSENCICDRESTTSQECEKCQEITDSYPYYPMPAPCESCQDTVKPKTPPEPDPCITCSQPLEEDILLPEPSPEESNICEVCEALKGKEMSEEKAEVLSLPPAVDSSLGYFEKKIRKITKVKRTQNPDGTIREETETITVRKEKHDPTETSLLDDDENEEYDVSYETLLDDEEQQIAMCSLPNANQRGFIHNKAKSDIVFRVSPMTMPTLKHYISYDGFGFVDNNSANDNLSVEIELCSLYCNSNIIPDSGYLMND